MQLVGTKVILTIQNTFPIQQVDPHPSGCMNDLMAIPDHSNMNDFPGLIVKKKPGHLPSLPLKIPGFPVPPAGSHPAAKLCQPP